MSALSTNNSRREPMSTVVIGELAAWASTSKKGATAP